jgi:phage shock protein A
MGMTLSLSLIVEIALSALLTATLVYCIVLERKLAALRKGQDGLKQTIAELNSAIVSAGSSMRMLKSAAASASETLDERLTRARSLVDELSLLTASGERIADRIDRGTAAKPANGIHPAALANRLDALKAGSVRPNSLGNIR